MAGKLVLALLLAMLMVAPAQANPTEDPLAAMVHITVSAKKGNQVVPLQEGSGFIVNEDGWVITAAHVLDVVIPDDASLLIEGSLRSRFNTAERFVLDRQGVDFAQQDVALLRFPAGLGKSFPYLCSLRESEPPIGTPIVGIGYPLGEDYAVREGKVSAPPNAKGHILGNGGWAQGMSGGPVLVDGSVAGIIVEGLASNSFDYFLPTRLLSGVLGAGKAAIAGEESCVPTPPAPIERRYPVDATNDSHDSVTSTTTKSYSFSWDADPGHSIIDARLEKTSATRESDENITISADRKRVTLTFNLKAGPKVDRYRGWLHGEIVLVMQKAPQ